MRQAPVRVAGVAVGVRVCDLSEEHCLRFLLSRRVDRVVVVHTVAPSVHRPSRVRLLQKQMFNYAEVVVWCVRERCCFDNSRQAVPLSREWKSLRGSPLFPASIVPGQTPSYQQQKMSSVVTSRGAPLLSPVDDSFRASPGRSLPLSQGCQARQSVLQCCLLCSRLSL